MSVFIFLVFFMLALLVTGNSNDCAIQQIQQILTASNFAICTRDTGISGEILTALTDDNVTEFCTSNSCKALVTQIAAMGYGDCAIPDMNVTLQTDILDRLAAGCDMNISSSSGVDVGDALESISGSNGSVAGEGSTSPANSARVSIFSLVVMTLVVLGF